MSESAQDWLTIAIAGYAVLASIAAITPTKFDDDILKRIKNLAMPIIRLLMAMGILRGIASAASLMAQKEVIVEAEDKYTAMATAAKLLGDTSVKLEASPMTDGKWSVAVMEDGNA